MENNFRVAFCLSELSLSIANENAAKAGLDFNRYFDKVIFQAMKKMDAEIKTTPYIVKRKQLRKPVLKNRHRFVQKLASKYNTSVSSAIEILLVAGLDNEAPVDTGAVQN
jgi:hypothetical protein